MTRTLICSVVIVIAAVSAAPAYAARTGGASVPGKAEVTAVSCIATAAMPCGTAEELVRGGRVRVAGRSLDASRTLVFRGKRGASDDVTAAARHVRPGHFEAVVPDRARSDMVEVLSDMGTTARAPHSVRVATPAPVDLATTKGTYFVGGQRQPQLTVSLAAPGVVSLEAVREPGAIVVARWDVAAPAGTSVVRWDALTAEGPAPSGIYHLRLADAGGDSGNADGCHLHFELWKAPGWYTGGSAIDPLALLRAWDAAS